MPPFLLLCSERYIYLINICQGSRVKGPNTQGLPLCAWEASQNQTRLPIPAFKVGQREYLMWNVESIRSGTITLVEIESFNICN